LPKFQFLSLGGVPALPRLSANPALKTVPLRRLRRLRSLPAAFAAVPNLILDAWGAWLPLKGSRPGGW